MLERQIRLPESITDIYPKTSESWQKESDNTVVFLEGLGISDLGLRLASLILFSNELWLSYDKRSLRDNMGDAKTFIPLISLEIGNIVKQSKKDGVFDLLKTQFLLTKKFLEDIFKQDGAAGYPDVDGVQGNFTSEEVDDNSNAMEIVEMVLDYL